MRFENRRPLSALETARLFRLYPALRARPSKQVRVPEFDLKWFIKA